MAFQRFSSAINTSRATGLAAVRDAGTGIKSGILCFAHTTEKTNSDQSC
ncbi:hypothetical protein [Dongia sp.]